MIAWCMAIEYHFLQSLKTW